MGLTVQPAIIRNRMITSNGFHIPFLTGRESLFLLIDRVRCKQWLQNCSLTAERKLHKLVFQFFVIFNHISPWMDLPWPFLKAVQFCMKAWTNDIFASRASNICLLLVIQPFKVGKSYFESYSKGCSKIIIRTIIQHLSRNCLEISWERLMCTNII